MTSRATPYGLFAGALTGGFHGETSIEFKPSGVHKTARIDMNYVNELYLSISTLPEIQGQLKYKVNNSLYLVGDKYRFISYNVVNKKRNYVISAVRQSVYIDKIFEKCREGALISEMVESLQSSEVSEAEATTYISGLIEAQILISDLEPTATGPEYFDLLIQKLKELKGTRNIVDHLNEIREKLKLQDNEVGKYYEIKQLITDNYVSTDAADLVQVDTFFEYEKATINYRVPERILKEIGELKPLIQKFTNSALDNFKHRFYARYEEKEVSLLLALDNELGVGYDKATSGKGDYLPLIEGIGIPAKRNKEYQEFGELEKVVHKIYKNAAENSLRVVHLTESDINEIKKIGFNAELTDSFYVMGTLESDSIESLNNEEFLWNIKAIGGPTSSRLLGRFCHADEKLYEGVKEAIFQEERLENNKIFAEVAHMPEARVGNILARPHLRKYEIAFMVGSSMEEEYQIQLNDLYVSVPHGNRIKIISKRLGKEIIPRITNAHNFSSGLSLYKFLGDLQSQNEMTSLVWSWGIHSNNVFLPRVQYKHLVLERAKWNLAKENLPVLKKSKALTIEDVSTIIQLLDLPTWVLLIEGDNELPINTKNSIAIKMLTDRLKKYGAVVLTEHLGNHKTSWLRDEFGDPIANELIIPCIKNKEHFPTSSISGLDRIPVAVKSEKRTFPIGSEWLYIKIYTGTKTADKILVEQIKPLLEKAKDLGLVEKWFFIRYNDPESHLRLRFYNSNHKVLWVDFLVLLYTVLNPLVSTHQIIKYQLDTYQRELERYTPEAIGDIENWFDADSSFILELIDAIEGDSGEEYRWLLGARAIDGILNGLGYSLLQKKEILSAAKESFFTEFNGNTELTVSLNNNYRKISKRLASFMSREEDEANEIDSFVHQLDSHHQAAAYLHQTIETRISPGQLTSITHSLIHMFLNRLFISNQRTHELVLYHYLFKYYDSQRARQKKNRLIEEYIK